jgi:NDP-sugar pyrophosphorylase family protein
MKIVGDGQKYGLGIDYSLEPELLGTAGAWKNLHKQWRTTSLVVYGDNVTRFDISEFVKAHLVARNLVTIALFDPDTHVNSGIRGSAVELDSSGKISAFVERPSLPNERAFTNAGAYLLEPAVLGEIGSGFQDFGKDVFPLMVRKRQLGGYVLESSGYCLGLDTPESFKVAERILLSNQSATR